MFEYEICNTYNDEVFEKQCAALEKGVNNLNKEDELLDVDGTRIQNYMLGTSKITVLNDKDFGVLIRADIDFDVLWNASQN